MSKPVVALLVVLGLGGLAWWWMRRQAGTAPTETAPSDPCSGGGVLDTVGGFIRDHVDRKNAIAPYVASAYTKMPPTQTAPLTNIAGKLSPSNYVEQYVGAKVGNALCSMSFPSISTIASTAGAKISQTTQSAAAFGTNQLKAGTIAPVQSIYSAGQSLARGDVTGAAKNVGESIIGGPKAAYTATKSFISSINPF